MTSGEFLVRETETLGLFIKSTDRYAFDFVIFDIINLLLFYSGIINRSCRKTLII